MSMPMSMPVGAASRQRGFSLVEVSVVMAIILLMAIIGVPVISNYVVESKVPKVGEQLARFVLQAKVNALSGSSTPYRGMNTASLASMVMGSSIFTVSGSDEAPRVLHGLGANGEVIIAEQAAGAAFSITLTRVSHAACPSIASVMQRVADTITMGTEGRAGAVVKDIVMPYSAQTAKSRCARGDVNTVVFTMS